MGCPDAGLFVYGGTLISSGEWGEFFFCATFWKSSEGNGEWASLLCSNLSVSCRTELNSEVSNLLKAWESSTRKLWDFFEGNGFILTWIDQHVKRILGKRHLPNLIQKRDVEAMGMVISVELGMGRLGLCELPISVSPTLPSNGLCPIHFTPLKTFETPQTWGKNNSLLLSILR